MEKGPSLLLGCPGPHPAPRPAARRLVAPRHSTAPQLCPQLRACSPAPARARCGGWEPRSLPSSRCSAPCPPVRGSTPRSPRGAERPASASPLLSQPPSPPACTPKLSSPPSIHPYTPLDPSTPPPLSTPPHSLSSPCAAPCAPRTAGPRPQASPSKARVEARGLQLLGPGPLAYAGGPRPSVDGGPRPRCTVVLSRPEQMVVADVALKNNSMPPVGFVHRTLKRQPAAAASLK